MGITRVTDLADADALTGDELVEVSQLSSTVTITGATISAQASDNSYNDSGSGFISAGFAVGDRVNVSGFTGNVANNIVVGTITALTAAKMTIGGSDGDVIVDDAAGETVTISKWTSRKALASDLGAGGGGGGGSSSYDIRFAFVAAPASSEIIDRVPIVRAITFPANFSAGVGVVGSNPASSFVMDVKDDGTTIGTITISTIGGFTFATTSGTSKSVAAGSILTLVAPATTDGSIANMSVVLPSTED